MDTVDVWTLKKKATAFIHAQTVTFIQLLRVVSIQVSSLTN